MPGTINMKINLLNIYSLYKAVLVKCFKRKTFQLLINFNKLNEFECAHLEDLWLAIGSKSVETSYFVDFLILSEEFFMHS